MVKVIRDVKIQPGQHIHLVGIGGAGLSAIARILLGKGYQVSGSDRGTNAQTEALARDGVTIYQGHDARYVEGADALIISSAVPQDHVEVVAAREQCIAIYKRQDMIADLMTGHRVIAVAGTHGKTTTTSMVAHILRECGHDPSYIVGGVMGSTGTNAAVGSGPHFVIEADEYDNMFHGLNPDIAILTSMEYDHPDFFQSFEVMTESFRTFVEQLPQDGLLVACAEDEASTRLAVARLIHDQPAVTYGLDHASARWRALNVRRKDEWTVFDVFSFEEMPGEEYLGTVHLPIPGQHNVLNALAALVVAYREHIPFVLAADALRSFRPAGRRFDVRGEAGGVAVIDDYAHHPTAIRVTLEAARSQYPDRQIWAVWQPHTYSRTAALFEDYTRAFAAADHVLVTDIYAAREQAQPDSVTGAQMAAAIVHPDARHTPSLEDTAQVLLERVTTPAAILIMSAGDAPRIGQIVIEALRQRETQGRA